METQDERSLAAQLYNRCWDLLETDPRSSEDDVELLTSSFTSRHHWLQVGGPEQLITSDWMVARAAGATGMKDLALFFAERAHDAAQVAGTPEWLVASTVEGVARAHAVAGNLDECNRWTDEAARLIELIEDEDDRKMIASQLAAVRDN
jgi:transcriptional regulator GlxA family with amidase domain